MIFRIIRFLIIGALVFTATWLYLLWQWQVSGRVVSPQDITIGLFVIPTAITAATAAAVSYILRYVQMMRSAKDQLKDFEEEDAAAAPPVIKYQAGPTLEIIQSVALTPIGNTYEEIHKALQEAPIPPLDAELTNSAGISIPSRRINTLDLDTITIGEDESLNPGEHRALAMMIQILAETHEQLGLIAEALIATDAAHKPRAPKAAQMHPAWSGEYATDAPPTIQISNRAPRVLEVLIALNANTNETFKRHVEIIVKNFLGTHQLADEKIEVRFFTPNEFRSTEEFLNKKIEEAHLDRRARVFLLIASTSNIDQETLDRWEAQEQIDNSNNIKGKLPGEAAACILLRNSNFNTPEIASSAKLTQWITLENTGKNTLSNLWKRLSGADPEAAPKPELALFSCKGFTKAAAESARFINQTFPELAENEDSHSCLGLTFCDCGAAAELVTLALAAQACNSEKTTVLLTMNSRRDNQSMSIMTPIEAPKT